MLLNFMLATIILSQVIGYQPIQEQQAAKNPIDSAKKSISDPEMNKVAGKWVVESVEKDGDFSKAQIGQVKGDLISIDAKNQVLS